ncbi:DNA-binding transcriptional regulator, PucR family [Lentzea waywayandensis]|uniref:DNA-binding transcriptional regulator, PucR family n=1 Tax=Lentzea waywayandensis TaxID=84724 RepID=A0A1I6FF61_9PSEU|nr:PucR family transcriptional regulator [Lentzea waywayandensis]SFR28585.1 DNA-binding transcriptional regulator, PucR family [Lentzea waywayandensis]
MVVQTVPLKDLVARVDLGLTVLCGADALDRPIRWAHVSELEDPTPYLVGEELLLTAGVRFPSDVPAYVAGLVASGVSAIGFGVEPEFPTVPSSLVEACSTQGMPLLEVPPSTPFLAVSQALGTLLAEIAVREQRMLADSQRALTRAATRVRPVESVLTTLAVVLNCQADLVDVVNAPEDVASLVGRVASGRGPRSASTQVGEDHVTLDPVESSVLVVRRSAPLSPAERAVVAVALALLGLLRRDLESERGQIARLAASALLRAEVSGVEKVLGPGPHRVVAGESKADYDVLAQRYGPLVSKEGVGFLALVPAGVEASGPVGVSGPVEVSGQAGPSPVSSPGDTAAPVSRSAIDTAAAEATSLLARAKATGEPAFPASGLSSLVDPVAAREYARRELAGLLGRPELIDTLRVWLGQHGSWDRAAGVLGVHRNSVRHRISHVERLLGRDLGTADARASLWLALTWLD